MPCAQRPSQSHLGLVVGAFRGESDSDADGYGIAFVSKSPPPTPGPDQSPGSFAVPIAPTELENANGRQPLTPKPFPWAGCYQYAVLGARVAPTRIVPTAIGQKPGDDDFEAFDTFALYGRRALDNQWDCMSSVSGESLWFEDMRMSDTAAVLPVGIWSESMSVAI